MIVLRQGRDGPAVLMGQRGQGAVFMPGKTVFPGGAVDPGDAAIPLDLSPTCAARLGAESARCPTALAAAALRELHEETAQAFGRPAPWPDPPPGWAAFAARGLRPDAAPLTFVFRAVTPVGRPRRFDARFFLAEADRLATDPDAFDGAEDELSYLAWVPLDETRARDLPFVTRLVLAEIAAGMGRAGPPEAVPFLRFEAGAQRITRIA